MPGGGATLFLSCILLPALHKSSFLRLSALPLPLCSLEGLTAYGIGIRT